jgi:CRP-like cAMP-binding protein
VPLVEIHLLRSIPLFAALPAPTLETLARALKPVRFAAGSVIIRQGDIGDRYYAIARGELDVLRDGVPVVSRLRDEGVGEIALIRQVRRTATVVARTDVELYALEREPFLLALTGHSTARRSADAIIRQRLEELEATGTSPV